MSAVYNSTVQGFYLSYYGRPADPAGLAFWTGQLAAANGNLDAILNAFGTSAEATRRYGTGTDASKIEAIYQQTFGRAADATGLAFYQQELAAGRMTLINASKRIIDGAAGDDIPTRANRLTAAQSFTDKLDTDAEKAGYSGSGAEDAARAWVATVTKDAASVTAAVATADATITGLLPADFRLTVNTDKWTGGAGNDKVTGSNSSLAGATTFNAADEIDGGAGSDTFSLDLPNAWTGFSTGFLKNVETLAISHVGATSVAFNAKQITGLETLTLATPDAGGLVTVTNAPAGLKSVGLSSAKGATGSTNTDFTLTYAATAAEVTGSSDSLKVELSGVGTNARSSTRQTPDQLNVNISSIENLDVTVSGTNVASFGIGATTLQTLKVSGSGSLNMHDIPTSFTSYDGSAGTGVQTLRFEDLTGATLATVKTGSAADLVTIQRDDVKVAATIDLGAGADTLRVDSTSAGILAATITGVETLYLNNITTET